MSLGPLSVANEVLLKLESSRHLKLDQLAETDVRELAHLLRTNNEVASRVQRLARCLPQVRSPLARTRTRTRTRCTYSTCTVIHAFCLVGVAEHRDAGAAADAKHPETLGDADAERALVLAREAALGLGGAGGAERAVLAVGGGPRERPHLLPRAGHPDAQAGTQS